MFAIRVDSSLFTIDPFPRFVEFRSESLVHIVAFFSSLDLTQHSPTPMDLRSTSSADWDSTDHEQKSLTVGFLPRAPLPRTPTWRQSPTSRRWYLRWLCP
jgi:hypothetical protein